MRQLVATTVTVKGVQAALISDNTNKYDITVNGFFPDEIKEHFETESIRNEYSLYNRHIGMRMFQFGSEVSRLLDEICYRKNVGEYPTISTQKHLS